MRRLTYLIFVAALFAILNATSVNAQSKAPVIAVVTPYMAQPGTQFMVEALQAYGKEKGWTVNVIDTAGDDTAAGSRLGDGGKQGANCIDINVDPTQGTRGLFSIQQNQIPRCRLVTYIVPSAYHD